MAVYENPTADTLVKGAMGSMVGIFAPRSMERWPRLEPEDSLFKRDLRFLARRGNAMMTARRQPQAPMVMDSMPTGEHHDHDQTTPSSHQ
ncbi:MAG: hypothetical protein ABI742_02225 [Gemmatimonadota bacterium]